MNHHNETAEPVSLGRKLPLPCGVVLPNRLAKAAMTEGLADSMNRVTDRHLTLYRRWARGGSGLMLTGNVLVDRAHLERPGNIAIDDNGGLAELRALAQAGTSEGAQFWMQINHPGRQTPAALNPKPLAPSAIPLVNPAGVPFGEPQEMTEAQIEDVIERFVRVATIARECGFTGVQIHAAHGYLISQFLSPLANNRRDAWGGSLENRARFLLECVRRTRKALGSDFPISVKLNSADFQRGGFTAEESMQVVRWLNKERLDLLEVSGGNYEALEMMGRSESQLDGGGAQRTKAESTLQREAYFLKYAAEVRPRVTVPVMITGGFRRRSAMLDALAAKEVDVIGLGRPLCADPDSCNGLLSGEQQVAPTVETDYFLERAALDPGIGNAAFRKTESFAQVAWCELQIVRLGDGLEPDLTMKLHDAIAQHQVYETAGWDNLCRKAAGTGHAGGPLTGIGR